MLIAVDGKKGSGKTFLIAKFLERDNKNGVPIVANFKLLFCEYRHFHLLQEIFGLTNCSIGIDEGQKLFEARRFMSLPPQFCEMVAGDRHDHITLYATTQNITHVDKRVRDNVDILYSVKRVFRFPFNDFDKTGKSTPALFQVSRYWRMEKELTPSGMVRWKKKDSHFFIISKFKKALYETYEKISMANYVWTLIQKKEKRGRMTLKIVSRSLIEAGKKRI
jgi:hypothetical protein